MPKISEQFYQDGDKLVHVKQHDYTPALEQAAFMRENGNATFGESVCIGVIDRALMAQWLKEAGVKSDDPAAEEVLKRKMLSGEYLRIAFTCMERFDLVEKVNDRNPAVFSEFI